MKEYSFSFHPIRAIKSAVATLNSMVFGRNSNMWNFLSSRNQPFINKVNYTESNVIMAPLLYIMRKEPEAPIILIDQDEEEVKDHDILTLLHRPNYVYSGKLMRMAIDLSFCLDGNAYLVKVRNNQLKVVELWYIPHFMIEPYVSLGSEEFIDYYKYTPDGKEIKLFPDDVIHLRYGIDPNNMRKGLSPLASAMKEVYTDEEAAAFSGLILKNAGVPGMVISPDSDNTISQADVTAVKEYVKTEFTGSNRGQPLILSGRTRVTPFSFSPADLDLSAIRNISEERITALLGIPAAVIGFGTGVQQTAVGATLNGLRKIAYEDGIMPLQSIYAEELHTQLLTEFEPDPNKYTIGYDYSKIGVLQEDRDSKIKNITEMVKAGILKVNKAQALAGLEVDDTQDFYLRGLSIIETGGNAPVITPTEPKKIKTISMKADKTMLIASRLAKRLMQDEKRLQAIWAAELEKRFKTFGKKCADMYEEEMNKLGEKGLIDTIIAELIMKALVTSGGKIELFGMAAHYLRTAQATIASINDVTDYSIKLTDIMEFNVTSAGGRRLGLVDLQGQTKRAMFEAVTEGRELGEGVNAIAKRIEAKVAAGPWGSAKTRAEVIARTETKYAQNYSSLEAYKGAENVGAVMVLDSQLGSFDEYCDAVNGITVTFAEATELMNEQHPNGTRSFSPVVATPEMVVDGLPEGVEPNQR